MIDFYKKLYIKRQAALLGMTANEFTSNYEVVKQGENDFYYKPKESLVKREEQQCQRAEYEFWNYDPSRKKF